MVDFLIGFAFVAMTFAPAIVGWLQWSKYQTAESESIGED
jgi:DNA-binding transcriptional regulator of glucitol operon